ncbi:hypothetical protein vseg_017534 [Gypsophila vaccaria]
MALDITRVFHMNGGAGDTSYAKNCTIQDNVLSVTNRLVKAAMHDYLRENVAVETITVAELGCSSGPTALKAVSEIMDVVEERKRRAKFTVYLVDLPSNDFNELFTLLPSFQKKLREEKGHDYGTCVISGLPGSFYDRLFPNGSLNFAHSSASLHWLSQVPKGLDGKDDPRMVNKGNVYLSNTSSPEVVQAYYQQFRNDFTTFLKHRSQELVTGGRLVIALMSRKSNDHSSKEDVRLSDMVGQALRSMVSQGLIPEEKVDSCNFALYTPCYEEVKQLIKEESSFEIVHYELVETDWDAGRKTRTELDSYEPGITRGGMIAKMNRAVIESILKLYFDNHVLDELFIRYSKILDEYLLTVNNNPKLINLVFSLKKH